ncbi:MAG: helix-turn-helix transcriptional regulator [Ruminococcus sp.]|nr:helix-turn-helix transcriptional regulator [Ruminococcus sp.]
MKINDTIKKLRNRDHLTQVELAEKLNCNRQKIADWERNKTTPAADDIILLSNVFKVSTDYLLGITEISTTDNKLKSVCEYTGLSEAAINHFFRSDTALHSRIVDFLNVLAKSKAGSLRLESLMGNLAEYKLANMKIRQLNENVPISHIEEVQNEIDMCQFRAERDFRDLLPAYCGTVAYYVFDDKGSNDGND